MITGDKFVNLVLKRLVGYQSFKDYFLDYLQDGFTELVSRVYSRDGTFDPATKVGFTFPGNDQLKFDAVKTGTDGSGHLLKTNTTESYYFENQTGYDYDVGLHYAERPSGVQINVRTGKPEYQRWEEVVGVADEPPAGGVTDQGGGVIRLRLPTSLTPGDRDAAGRKCLVWMKVPADGATTEAIAIEECTVAFSTFNYIETTSNSLGQTTISTDETEYMLLLLGPTIARTTDLDIEAAADYWYIGEVTGNGPSATPTTSYTTDQWLITKSLSDLLENLVYDNVVNTFTRGQIIIAGGTNEVGLDATGKGNEAGLLGKGGAADAPGVVGQGGGTNGWGMSGEGKGTGAGLRGSAVDGYAVLADGKASSPVRASLRVTPQNGEPSTANEDGADYVHSTNKKRATALDGEFRTFSEKKSTRTFLYPIACGVPDQQATEPHWYWNAGNHEWNSDNLVTPEYIVFDLNRFVPQGATLYAVRLYVDPGAARAAKGNRTRIQLLSENNTGANQTEHFRAYYPYSATHAAEWMYLIGGTHDGGDGASVLTDSWQSWTVNELVGRTVYNLTDGSSGTITANTATTVTATLSGGTDNDWDNGDIYKIDLDEELTSATRQWYLMLWSGNDNQVDLLHSIEIQYIENEYTRVP